MLFDFLKGRAANFLKELGLLNRDLPSTYEIKEVNFDELLQNGTANLTSEKAWIVIPTDIEVPVYFYKREFNFQFNSNGELLNHPRFHIRKCQTIEQFGEDNYNASNSKTVTVKNSNHLNGSPEYTLTLQICQNCVNEAIGDRSINTTEEFNKWLHDNYKLVQKVGPDGYPVNWLSISREFRKLKNYTCESCGRNLSQHRKFLHVHHKDHNKLNCNTSNLEALCIRCHSKQDLLHESNFAAGKAKKELEEFNKLFPEP